MSYSHRPQGRYRSRRSYRRNRVSATRYSSTRQRGSFLAIMPASPVGALTTGTEDALYGVAAVGSLEIDDTTFTAGNKPGPGIDFVIRKGYIDLEFINHDTVGHHYYIFESMLGPGESTPVLTNGLQDGTTLNKLFTQKRVLGITHVDVPLPNQTKAVRVRLSKTTVLRNSGYFYIMNIYSADATGTTTWGVKRLGGKMLWDRIT